MTPEQEQALLDATALGLDNDLRDGYRKLVELIGNGMAPRDAIREVMADFRGQYAELLASGFSAIMERSVGNESVLAMQVSGLTLSQRLYKQSREVSATVAGIIDRHAKGFHDARQLTLDMYEGYGFKNQEVLNLSPRNSRLPKYLRNELLTDPGLRGELARHFTRVQATNLKTPALKAAYLQYLDGIEKGAGQAALDKKMRVAFHERMRYFANRIAQTELHRAYADRQAVELMGDPDVEYVQWRMSGTHPKTDICDMLAKVDKYGLGPGVYPKAKAPKAPAHPFCRCILAPRLDIRLGTKAKERAGAEREWLRQQGGAEAAQVMGSRARRDAVLKGADPLDVWNSRSDPMYRVGRIGGAISQADKIITMQKHPDSLPNVENADIPLKKLSNYALDPQHPTGGHKARRIKAALGFEAKDAEQLAMMLRAELPAHPAQAGVSNAWGRLFYVDIPLTGPSGKAIVRTSWIIDEGQDVPRLTSFYVKES